MCRFALYLGQPIKISSLVTEPTHSLILQSYKSKERNEPLNGDGFGMAWYLGDKRHEPAVFKDVTPAWSNKNAVELAKSIESDCILVHVRAATGETGVSYSNCHPFKHGQLTFMHNGVVGGFKKIKRALRRELSDQAYHAIEGNTDSEHAFGLMIDRYAKSLAEGADNASAMIEAVRGTIHVLEEMKGRVNEPQVSQLNFVLCDGKNAVISRYSSSETIRANTLYYSEGGRFVCENGVCTLNEKKSAKDHSILVASEPLNANEVWSAVKPNDLLIIKKVQEGYEKSFQAI